MHFNGPFLSFRVYLPLISVQSLRKQWLYRLCALLCHAVPSAKSHGAKVGTSHYDNHQLVMSKTYEPRPGCIDIKRA